MELFNNVNDLVGVALVAFVVILVVTGGLDAFIKAIKG